MPKRAVEFARGCYYHAYNRGFFRNPIFYNPTNSIYALKLIQKYFPQYGISIIAYCLMPNHYYFLVRQDGDICINAAIRDTFNAYVQGFNRQFKRQGALFQGRFQTILVEDESYLIHLFRYIHRNPIDCHLPLISKLDDWQYSNYPEWIGKRNGKFIDTGFVKEYFQNRAEYQSFVMERPNSEVLRGIGKYVLY